MKAAVSLSFSRRRMLQAAAGSVAFVAAPAMVRGQRESAPSVFDLLRQPDLVQVESGSEPVRVTVQRTGDRWSGSGVDVMVQPQAAAVAVTLAASDTAVHRLHLRWRATLQPGAAVLGDAWERSYGDLAWLPMRAERALPWYFLYNDAAAVAGAGVKTGAAAMAFWQVDAEGISLWLDVRNGGQGVRLGQRSLHVATVVQLRALPGQSAWQLAGALCEAMAQGTAVPQRRGQYRLDAIYGSNDWYYAYGRNTPEGVLRDAALMHELAPAGAAAPFCIVDDGYQDRNRFPSMARLSEDIRQRGAAPGVWVRPLRAARGTPANLLLPQAHWASRTNADLAFDPTVPEARARVLAVVQEACDWGYDFIKHDFTTYELLGQWGFEMGPSPTRAGWSFYDGSRTNAEIIRALYADIRRTAGEDRIILGCNTVGHLSVGLFDASRTGDDVSGRNWERTRHMGVNTLAFRLPQHRTFFQLDADCVPITPEVPWTHTEAWLRAVAASGSVLLVSPDPKSMGPEQRRAVRAAFQQPVAGSSAEPLDWKQTNVPTRWKTSGTPATYQWLDAAGADPFA